MVNLAKRWGPHHMAIRYQENGAYYSWCARRTLTITMSTRVWEHSSQAERECWEQACIKDQRDAWLEYSFARSRMGLVEADYLWESDQCL